MKAWRYDDFIIATINTYQNLFWICHICLCYNKVQKGVYSKRKSFPFSSASATQPPQGKRDAGRQVVVWWGFTNNWGKKRRERQGGKERYIQLNAEFQGIARRNKKALGEQCKEIEESSRMGKTCSLFKEIGGIKGTFHARMGTIRDRNGKDLTAEEI